MWLFIIILIVGHVLQEKFAQSWPDPYFRSKGAVWPQPQYITIGSKSMIVDSGAFKFVSTVGECEIIDKAIERYQKRLFDKIEYSTARMIKLEEVKILADEVLNNLTIIVDGGCIDELPQFGMDESYKLSITNSTAILKANQVWGILRGLESFAHLFYDQNTRIRKAEIRDYPRFLHRGVLLDTARHYLSIDVLKANIELMAQNKFNTFHWHIVDIESFPFKSEVIPELIKGAFTPNHIYTISQIKLKILQIKWVFHFSFLIYKNALKDVTNFWDIINYGRLRGIRVVPEFDTPGHMKSWGIGVKDLLTKCYHANGSIYENFENLLDPTNPNTWDVLTALFQEIFSTFQDNYIHLGGDEAQFWFTECWTSNPNIRRFMEIYGLKDGSDIQAWYFSKFIPHLLTLKNGRNKKFLVWEEVIMNGNLTTNGITNADIIAHIWKDMDHLDHATKMGYSAILSACWYLDWITATADWKAYYRCDPQDFNGTQTQKRLVLGGEAALWGEWVDESNVISRLWPRASAVAERLWSSAETKDIGKAWPRLYEMQCRMKAQGYPVQPVEGPGYCEHEYKFQLPLYE